MGLRLSGFKNCMPAPTAVNAASSSSGPSARTGRPLLILAGILLVVLGFLFRASFDPDQAMFANDGPFGYAHSRVYKTPDAFFGVWNDLNWLGGDAGNLPPDFTGLMMWILSPLGWNKLYPVITIAAVGFAAALFFRELGFRRIVSVLGGTAAALNTDFFSYACWGLGTLPLCVASVFLALACLASSRIPRWLGLILGGAALGHGLMEGFDNGAIFSLYVAAFVVARSLFRAETFATPRRLLVGILETASVACVSALIAAHILLTLIEGNISNVVGMGRDEESKAARWEFATQWSLPPKEALRTIVPGLYGYRMDTEHGGQYWGTVGMHPAWDSYWSMPSPRDPNKRPNRELRFSGAGHYAGVLVVLVGVFAFVRSLGVKGGIYSLAERRWVWFWAGSTVLSLLLAFGRFAPFYQFIYSLPYFSTIRNPVKFLHPFSLGLVVLFAYGLEALWRGWVDKSPASSLGPTETISRWWKVAGTGERRWVLGSLCLAGSGFLSWMIFGANREGLLRHLAEVGFTDHAEASAIARFSQGEIGLSVLFLSLSVALIILVLSGWLAGSRARLASLAFGAVLIADLARANTPWILHYNWRERYANNAVFQALSERPHEARVTGNMPFSLSGQAGKLQQTLASVYGVEWLQHQLRYYDIQALDIVQMPRMPEDLAAYKRSILSNPLREWELSNTRYLLTLAPLVDAMNSQFGGTNKPFRLHTAFSLSQTASRVINLETNTSGPFALIEFTNALPRASLFDQWRSGVPDDTTLSLLASTNFNPHSEVVISEQIPAPSVQTSTQPAGSCVYLDYSPRRLTLATEARTPCVLLLNDKHDPRWKVRVDGKDDTLLRANFIMRGVYLSPGKHRVEFRHEPPTRTFWFSLSFIAIALCLAGYAKFLVSGKG